MPVRREGIVDLAAAGVTPAQEVPGLAAVGIHLQGLDEKLDGFGLPGGTVAQLIAAVMEPT